MTGTHGRNTQLQETNWGADVVFDTLALVTSALLLWVVSKGLKWEYRGAPDKLGTQLLVAALVLLFLASAFDLSNDGYALATWTGAAPHKAATCWVVTYLIPQLCSFPANLINIFLVLRISFCLSRTRPLAEHQQNSWASSRNLGLIGVLLFVSYSLVGGAHWLLGIIGLFYKAYLTGFNTEPFFYPANILELLLGMLLLLLVIVMAFPLISLLNMMRSSGHAFTLFLYTLNLLAFSIRSILQVVGSAYVLTQYDHQTHRFASTVAGTIIQDVLLTGVDTDLQCCALIAIVFMARRAPFIDALEKYTSNPSMVSWPVKVIHVKTGKDGGATLMKELEIQPRSELEAAEIPAELSNDSARNELADESKSPAPGPEKPWVYLV